MPGTYQFSTYALGRSENWLTRLAGKTYLIPWVNSKLDVAGNLVRWKMNGGFSFEYKVDVGTAWQEEPWSDILRQLSEMKRVAADNGASLFIAAFPLGWQYDAESLKKDHERVLFPQRRLKEICEKLKIPFYDLYPALNVTLFEADAMHLTKAGRTRVGTLLTAFMKNAGIVTSRTANPPN